jgi:hypothetical protein
MLSSPKKQLSGVFGNQRLINQYMQPIAPIVLIQTDDEEGQEGKWNINNESADPALHTWPNLKRKRIIIDDDDDDVPTPVTKPPTSLQDKSDENFAVILRPEQLCDGTGACHKSTTMASSAKKYPRSNTKARGRGKNSKKARSKAYEVSTHTVQIISDIMYECVRIHIQSCVLDYMMTQSFTV